MIITNRKSDLIVFYTGLFFISIVTLPFIVQSLFFFINAPVYSLLFPLVCLSAFVFCVIQLKNCVSIKHALMWSISICLLIVGTYFLCIRFYDFSYDGMWYHQDGVRLFAQGWNPNNHYLSLEETSLSSLYLNHYPKAAWISAGSIYAFTNKLESGKIINWFVMYAAASFCYLALRAVFKLNKTQLILLTILIALNPVVIYQLLTFYVDGLVASLLTCFVCLAVLFQCKKLKPISTIYFATLVIAFTINIKFTSLIFISVLSFGSLIYTLINTRKLFLKQSIILASIFIFGVVILGYTTYVRNTLDYTHPFYPIMGEGNVGEQVANVPLPANFFGKNRFEQFNLATFARPQWSRAPNESKPKALFTFDSIVTLDEYRRADPEMSGFGPLFGEVILLVALGLVLLILLNYRKPNQAYLIVAITLFVSIVIIPGFWYARYAPQLWLLVLLFIIPLFKHAKLKFVGYALCVFLFINCALVCQQNMICRVKQTNALNKQFEIFKKSKTTPIIYTGWLHSVKIKLEENNVNYKVPIKNYPTDSITFIPNIEMSGAFFVSSSIN